MHWARPSELTSQPRDGLEGELMEHLLHGDFGSQQVEIDARHAGLLEGLASFGVRQGVGLASGLQTPPA